MNDPKPKSWLQHHRASEQFLADAETATWCGEVSRAQKLYAQAAAAEKQALTAIKPTKSRTLGITVVSVVSLYYKAAKFQDAELMARQWLNSTTLPNFAIQQLQELLQIIQAERSNP